MGFKIDGIATNGAVDSSGEIMNVRGHDISDLVDGKGVLNWEHNNDSSEDIIGHIVYAKKIYDTADCSNERERKYLKLSKGPYVYIIAELFDDEQHPGAIAAAALIRYYHKRELKVLAGFSIEGHTLVRNGNYLDKSVGRRVALTLRPCNKASVADVLEDSIMGDTYKKSISVTNNVAYEVDSIILDDPITDIFDNIEALNKTLTAGNYDAAPSSLTGGAALQIEDKSIKNRLKAAVRDWDKKRPLKEIIKAALPEVGDNYVDYFSDVAEELMLKKGDMPLSRISSKDSTLPSRDSHQDELITGLYGTNDLFDSGNSADLRNDYGTDVAIKRPYINDGGVHSGLASSAYYSAAKDVFGMQDHVPISNTFRKQKEGAEVSIDNEHHAVEKFHGAKTPLDPSSGFKQHLDTAVNDGSMIKLSLMDAILGFHDRNLASMMVGKNGALLHTDNSDSFIYSRVRSPISIEKMYESPLPEGVYQWLAVIDPRSLVRVLSQSGIDEKRITKAVKMLEILKRRAKSGTSLGKLINVTEQ